MVTLVLLPGMDGTGDLFADFAAALGAGIVPLVVPYPDDPDHDYRALTELVRTQLPTDRPFVLLGECFSGPVAIALAASKPAGLLGLVLCCSFARNPLPVFNPFKALVPLLPISSGMIGLIMPFILGRFSSPGLRIALRRALDKISPATVRARLRAVQELDYSEKLKDIAVPTLYLQAASDRIVPSSSARHVAILMPAAQVVALQGPHLLLQAVPEQAAIVVNRFVREAVLASATAGGTGARQSASSSADRSIKRGYP